MDLLSNARFDIEILKEPRGFIRVIQLVLSIFAFGTIVSVKTYTTIFVDCGSTSDNKTILQQINVTYGYPFRVHRHTPIPLPFCPNTDPVDKYGLVEGNFSSAAEFFTTVGVLTFLVGLFIVPAYLFFGSMFSKGLLASKIDFIASVVWTAVWFIASTAWADNLTKLNRFMNPETIITGLEENGHCKESGYKSCIPGIIGDHSTLVVSVLFGYLNMGLLAATLWFLFKETEWHKDENPDDHFDQAYADPGYQTPEYTQEPDIPSTPTDSQPGYQPNYQQNGGGQPDYYSPSQGGF